MTCTIPIVRLLVALESKAHNEVPLEQDTCLMHVIINSATPLGFHEVIEMFWGAISV